MSRSEIAPPVTSTAPPKSLPALASVTSPVPASSSVVPPTCRAPPCTIAPPLLCATRSEEHTSELQSLMRNSYAVFCLQKKTHPYHTEEHSPSIQTQQRHS